MGKKDCRLCQSNPAVIDVSTPENNDLNIRIFECTKINVNIDNTFPKIICNYCKATIDKFYNYLQIITEIDKKLQLSKQINKKKILADEENPINRIKIKQEKNSFVRRKEISVLYNNVTDLIEDPDDNFDSIKDEVESIASDNKLTDFSCQICKTKFILETELWKHKRIYHNNYECNWKNCTKICKSAYTLKTHHMKHAGQIPYLCVTCGKRFVTKNSLNSHEKIHLDVKGHVCEICNIGFSIRSNLRSHEKKHHEGVRFYCSQCTRCFISKGGLNRHEKLHTGIRDYQCHSCSAAFYTNKELEKHQRYHLGVKPFKCEECYKSFFEKHHLTIHMRSHSGEKPYACNLPGCLKTFAEKQKVTRHRKTRHALLGSVVPTIK